MMLADRGLIPEVEVLLDQLANSRSHERRIEAIKALPRKHSLQIREALIGRLTDAHPDVIREANLALCETYHRVLPAYPSHWRQHFATNTLAVD